MSGQASYLLGHFKPLSLSVRGLHVIKSDRRERMRMMEIREMLLRKMMLSAGCLLAAMALGCGDGRTEPADATGTDVTTPTGGYCAQNPAVDPGSFCASIQMPDEISGAVEKVSFHFFSTLPPAGPPTLMGLELATPTELAPFVAGAEVPMLIENLPSEGEMFLLINVYMPNGGATSWIAVSGVDYVGGSDPAGAPIKFTGEPINLDEPFELTFAE